MKHNRFGKILAIVLSVVLVVTAVLAVLALQNDGSELTKTVNDYSKRKPEITGEKVKLEDMELAEKQWFEYVEYELSEEQTIEENGVKYLYRFYAPKNYSSGSIMAIRDYDPVGTTAKDGLDINWGKDLAMFAANMATAEVGLALTGGLLVLPATGASSVSMLVGAGLLFANQKEVAENAMYYSRPEFMGIPGTEWNGVSQSGFYSASSITIQMDETNAFSVGKTTTISSDYAVNSEVSVEAGTGGILAAVAKADVQNKQSASLALGQGLDFQQNQSVDRTHSVSRTFDARADAKVEGVGWKLCEYTVRIPYMVECYRVEGNEKLLVETSYINYDLLRGVCRAYANGYIEHWNTGKLVNYADFFDGFITSEQLVAKAKEEMHDAK